MVISDFSSLVVEQHAIASRFLNRQVVVDFLLPKNVSEPDSLSVLLINDGQNLDEMNFPDLLDRMLTGDEIRPLVCVGIHAGKERKSEYGTARIPDFAGRGGKADAYTQFILEELLPFLQKQFAITRFRDMGFCGFSLGGLSALDITWRFPERFSVAGVFSGSLWWRSRDLDENYNDDTDRIMHQLIRKGKYQEGLRFYFMTGSQDETADRNNNGIIDSIDDTLDLIKELKLLGYEEGRDIRYVNYEDGKHDIETWARAMPDFLQWNWRK